MRLTPYLLVLIACALLPTNAAAAPPDPLAELKRADFATVEDVRATVPYGSLRIDSGVIAMFRGLDRLMQGVLIGKAEARLDKLPADDALNLFTHKGRRGDALRFEVEVAYLSAAITSDAQVQSEGKVLALRRWEQLSKGEQEQFAEVYLQAYADSWVTSVQPEVELREPRAKEFYAAFWAEPVDIEPDGDAPAGELRRYDMRVNADGSYASILDHESQALLYAWPHAADPGTSESPPEPVE